MPIHVSQRMAGRIDIVGPAGEGQALPTLAKFVELIEDLIPQIELLVASDAPASNWANSAGGHSIAAKRPKQEAFTANR